MSIKEFFEKLFTAKNGVRNLIILIICSFIVSAILDKVRDRNECRKYQELFQSDVYSCERIKEILGKLDE